MHTEMIGDLLCWVTGQRDRTTIVLLHGYGSCPEDLYPLHRMAPDLCWIFPQGLYAQPPTTRDHGWAWFPIKIDQILDYLKPEQELEFEQGFPSEIHEARSKLDTFLQAIDLPPTSIFLGGFSQGAILSTEVVLSRPQSLGGLILLSGSLLYASRWRQLAPTHQGMPFFQSHGHQDQILPFYKAEALYHLLAESGLRGTWHPFMGGHELPVSVWAQLRKFLETETRNAQERT